MTYWTQFWRQFFKLSSLPFHLDRWLFRLPTGWHFGFGFWIRCTVDSPGAAPSAILNETEEHYSHDALDKTEGEDFRLLKLHPGNSGDPIRISLIATALYDAPAYEAISYVWGNGLDRAEIIVDSCRFSITKNLHDAFGALRHSAYYAILAIIESDQRGSFDVVVDYSLGVEEVYERFRAAIQQISEIEDVPLA
ncbi:uncharacterized protein J4E84_006416 [Alternaria hordeiaustralica]|uniref:uncharacterized protein n=1 Tax=Alternaria hordeiaustralica TaxID=1187925 RepID=UPI0020C2CE82|nr:uncharacterized protein J4E84_006416 [Alternaria hordeiaustralica]KAI4684426.1 hypothetical protein J4E84_006416 [Alternaria hordeiaustralica]